VLMYQRNVLNHTKNVKIHIKDLSVIVNMATNGNNDLKVKGNAIGSCCLLHEIGTETNHKFNMVCVFEIRY
jgi:hypothetical protein